MADEKETVDIFDLSEEFNFGEAPTLVTKDPMAYFQDLLVTEADYPKTPTLSDAEIEALYAPSDYSGQKKLALAQFGFGLMRPTERGKIGASLAPAGEALAGNLAKIQQAQMAEASANRKGVLTAKMQQRAAELADKKAIMDINRGVRTSVANALYNKDIATDAAAMKAYTDGFKSAKLKEVDYRVAQLTPKKGQFRLPDGTGGYGEPFVGYTINVPGEGPQFYRPTEEIDATTGLPKMELITNPAGIQEMSTSMTGSPGDFKMRGVSQALDIKSQLDTYDRNIMYLSDLRNSIGSNKLRAGFLAGLKLKGQDFASIMSDALGGTYNDFFKEGNENLGIKPNTKFQPISATIDAYLNDPKTQQQIDSGIIREEDIESLRNLQSTFSQIAATGKGQLDADVTGTGGNVVYGQEAYFGNGFNPVFENATEQDKIMTRLKWFDKDLPLNQNDLRMARNAAYNSLAVIPGFEPVFEKMKDLGYATIDFERLRGAATAAPIGGEAPINFTFTVQEDGSLTQTP